jgi:hypothetical protein
MKNYFKIASLLALFGLGASSLIADNKASCSSDCNMPCSWDMSMDRFYISGGASYVNGSNFHGWGGSGRVGYFFHPKHALEVELSYFDTDGDSTYTDNITTVAGAGHKAQAARMDGFIKANFDQWPLMFNYAYHTTFADLCCNGCQDWMKRWHMTLGGGIGLNFLRLKVNETQTVTPLTTEGTPETRLRYMKHSDTKFGGQIFARLGFAVTEKFCLMAGIRGFFTDNEKLGYTNHHKIKTPSASVVVDLGAGWHF